MEKRRSKDFIRCCKAIPATVDDTFKSKKTDVLRMQRVRALFKYTQSKVEVISTSGWEAHCGVDVSIAANSSPSRNFTLVDGEFGKQCRLFLTCSQELDESRLCADHTSQSTCTRSSRWKFSLWVRSVEKYLTFQLFLGHAAADRLEFVCLACQWYFSEFFNTE